MRTTQQLKTISKDIVDNKIFISLDPEEIQMCFMVLMFAKEGDIPSDTVAVFEYYDKAGPRSCNGKPMFLSAAFLSKEEMGLVRMYVEEYQTMIKNWA